jgi:hypothetical protein
MPSTCSGCGRAWTPSAVQCLYCGAAPGETTQRREMDAERVRTEVRARVLWGDRPDEIRRDISRQGGNPAVVETAIREATAERHRHFRGQGLRDLLYGGLCAAGFVLCLLLLAMADGVRRVNVKGVGMLFLVTILAGVSALFFSVRGVHRLLRGGADEGAATDIDEDLDE